MSGGAYGVDQLRLDVVRTGQTASAGRVLFVSYDWIHFFTADQRRWTLIGFNFSFLNLRVPACNCGSKFHFLFPLHRGDVSSSERRRSERNRDNRLVSFRRVAPS